MNADPGRDEADRARELPELARRIRMHVLRMTSTGGSSHVGSAFSIAEVMAALYGDVMRVDPTQPRWEQRDRFILSKGHAGAAVYAALAERGFFGTDQLIRHYQNGSIFSGHVSSKGVPGVELSTGSLGHGLGVAVGMAYALRQRDSDSQVFTLLSDGECDEGSNWEAILFAGHHRLGRAVAIVDYNKIQSLKPTEETLGLEPFADKWRAFRWEVREVDGHDTDALVRALKPRRAATAPPLCVIAHTTKGKGVSFMENSVLWHYRTARGAEFDAALAELERPVTGVER